MSNSLGEVGVIFNFTSLKGKELKIFRKEIFNNFGGKLTFIDEADVKDNPAEFNDQLYQIWLFHCSISDFFRVIQNYKNFIQFFKNQNLIALSLWSRGGYLSLSTFNTLLPSLCKFNSSSLWFAGNFCGIGVRSLVILLSLSFLNLVKALNLNK